MTAAYNPETGVCDIEQEYDTSKRILVIEGIFLYHEKQFRNVFDLKVFLECDRGAADQRRIAREKAKWGDDYFPHDHPDSYFRLVSIAFDRCLATQKPKEFADLILSV
ncbi:MAG: hypothetical protein ACOYUZ_06370 [Patescibacteria group bacterium]